MKHLLKKATAAALIASAPVFSIAQQPFTMGKSNAEKLKVKTAVSADTVLQVFSAQTGAVYGLSVDADITLHSKSSYASLVLIDNQNNEYLIFETNYMLAPGMSFSIKDYSDETADLAGIQPISLKVVAHGAEISVKSINLSTAKTPVVRSGNSNKKEEKYQYKLAKIQQKIKDDNLPWFAGETGVSKMSYAEKQEMMGDISGLPGIEYYQGGIYVITGPPSGADGSAESAAETSEATATQEAPSSFVKEFSWRNRHGLDWTTPVKSQMSNTCWAFATVASIEQMVNMYYNNPDIDLDLSEQQVVSCSGGGSYSGGGWPIRTYPYTTTIGVNDDESYPMVGDLPCPNSLPTPTETIIHESFEGVTHTMDGIKAAIITRPLTAVFRNWSHAVNLVGYKLLENGDVVHTKNGSDWNYTITEGDGYAGKTVWEIKNSWGTNTSWGVDGYGYVYETTLLPSTSGPTGSITSLNFDDNDIQCLDRDGDGYYTWGLGDKPAHCPSCPDQQDGDDSDPIYGPMDYYGNLQFLGQNAFTYMTIPGTIEAENYDVSVNDPTYYDKDPQNNGGAYRNDGVDIANGGLDGGYNIGWITPGEYTEYTIASTEKDRYNLSFAVASPGPDAGSQIKMSINGEEVTTVDVINTGGWGNWQTIEVIGVHIAPGENKIVRFDFSGGYYNFDKVTITPDPGLPPVADAGPDQEKMDINEDGIEQFNLIGTNSSDPEGMPLTYSWSMNGEIFDDRSWAYKNLPVGVHTVTLTVTDEDGNQASDDAIITVKAPNYIYPVADAGPDLVFVDEDGDGYLEITLDGSASYDPEGEDLKFYRWSDEWGGGTSGILVPVNFSICTEKIMILTVTDADGYQDSDTVLITILPQGSNTPPLANAGQDITVTDTDNNGSETVALLGSAIDADGDPMTYQWTDGNGTLLGTGLALAVNLPVGEHVLTFTATDNNGGSGEDNITVTVLQFVDDGQDPFAVHAIPGTIEGEDYDLGGEGFAFHDSDATNSGGQYRTDGVDISQTSTGGYSLGWFFEGEWTEYTVASVQEGTYTVGLTFASTGPINGSVDVTLNGALLGSVQVPNTGDWNSWQTVYINDVELAGMQDAVLRLGFHGEMYSFDKVTFSPSQGGNMIINGTFSQGELAWQTYIDPQADALIDFVTEYGDCRAVVYDGGNEVWHTQMYQSGLLLEQGRSYMLSFDATTYGHITEAEFDVQVEQNGGSYTAYMQPIRVSVNPGTSGFSYIFTMNSPTDPDARLTFNMGMNEYIGGGFAHTIGFDNIELVALPGASGSSVKQDMVEQEAVPVLYAEAPLAVMPNPASQEVTAAFSLSKAGSFTVTAAQAGGTGTVLLASGMAETGMNKAALDISGLSAGMYICTLTTEEKTETVLLIVK